jgi:hypothetical protein
MRESVGESAGVGRGKGESVAVSRRRRDPRVLVSARIGGWPHGVGRPGPGREHAVRVWLTARSGVVSSSEALWAQVGRNDRALGGQADLALLGTLAGHLRRCEDCWREWSDGQRPVDLITEAVKRRAAGDVFRPLLRQIRTGRVPGPGHGKGA